MAVATATSAAGLLAQLNETDSYLQLSALESLNALVHEFWFQIATSIASVEAFYEDETFSHRKLAALLASKVQREPPNDPHGLRTATECLALCSICICRFSLRLRSMPYVRQLSQCHVDFGARKMHRVHYFKI